MDPPNDQSVVQGEQSEISTLVRSRDDGDDSRSGSEQMDGASGDEQDVALDRRPRKKKYHRHTPSQIQDLENFFKECPHPDEKQRGEMSRRLGLEVRQIKFWFQNRRTQMKNQSERHDNALLKQENEKLRAENELLKQAYANPVCTSCGGSALPSPVSVEHEQLRTENGRLKRELLHVCSVSNKLLGKPAASSSAGYLPPFSSSKMNLAMGGINFGGLSDVESMLPFGLDYIDGLPMPPMRPPPLAAQGYEPSYDKSALVDLALVAMDELMKKAQVDGPLWMNTLSGPEVLNQDEYARTFAPCFGPKPGSFVTDATRETGIVLFSGLALVEILMDMEKFIDMFPAMVARASTTHVIGDGVGGTKNIVLQVVLAEYQVVSPLVPLRQVKFLRFCKQQAENVWALVDVSVDVNQNAFSPPAKYRKLPSGCVIQETPEGCCKVTWIEHWEYDESEVHQLFKPVLSSGRGLGARRWLATLQRRCESLALLSTTLPSDDQSVLGVEGKKNLLKLARRMVTNFCSGISGSWPRKWEKLDAGILGEDLRILVRKSLNNGPGEPSGVVMSAATSVWLHVAPKLLFDYLTDNSLRSQWDILSHAGSVQEMVFVPNGQRGNRVSILCSMGADANITDHTMMVLQETWTDHSGSMIIYAPIDVPAVRVAVNGEDSAYVDLLPSGFAITPDGSSDIGNPVIPTERADGDLVVDGDGSILTVGYQILVSSLPLAKLTTESVRTVHALITSTVEKIKSAFQLP